jgi:S-adenosylmethionine:tRNA ribosyltransferase-isomerase
VCARDDSVRAADFDYDLPTELIAQRPLERRDQSRLLRLDRATGRVSHHVFLELPDLLRQDDVLVFNESKVIPARLHGRKSTGGRVECLLVRQLDERAWEAMTRPGLRAGQEVTFGEPPDDLGARVSAVDSDGLRHLAFDVSGTDLRSAIWRLGEMPTPPYVRERIADPERYQTVYAREEGSVAAPTAGFHFTPEILDRLRSKGMQLEFVTLHVGLGTFLPVKVEDVAAHQMHSEYCRVAPEIAARLTAAREAGRRIVAVGTTAVRTLETAAGENGRISPFAGETRLFIRPGYRFRAVEAMVTNFHLPRSTLLMLVAAFAGRAATLDAYEAAVSQRYRFYSFGDAMLIS